jgi:hypothetical protein
MPLRNQGILFMNWRHPVSQHWTHIK